MEEDDIMRKTCKLCGYLGLANGNDGFYYCVQCGAQADDIQEVGIAEEDFLDMGGGGAVYQLSQRRLCTSQANYSQSQLESQTFWSLLTQQEGDGLTQNNENKKRELEGEIFDGTGPAGLEDFGSQGNPINLEYDDYVNEVRLRYVMGLQKIIQLQCEALVEKFKVTPLICGIVGSIWLRFVSSTKVFQDVWADEIASESQLAKSDNPDKDKHCSKYRAEPHTLQGKRLVSLWLLDLKKRMPLSCSLAVSFLACHVAGEAVLPTDIVKWSVEGKLQFFAAYQEIEKEKEFCISSAACPFSLSQMFRPFQAITAQNLESFAASIAQAIGLHLPSVNFYGIAFRYLEHLSLPIEKILPHACRLYEWSMPPELWLSENELRLPTRACVISILIVAIRKLYNIHGFGAWEKSLSRPQTKEKAEPASPSIIDDLHMRSEKEHVKNSDLDATELMYKLEAQHNVIGETYEFSNDLQGFLQFCRDTVFAGCKPSHEDIVEERTIEKSEDFYQSSKGPNPSSEHTSVELGSTLDRNEKSREGDDSCRNSHESENAETLKSRAIKRLERDMEEHRFSYIPPRKGTKLDALEKYLHYTRKKDKGAYTYLAHADYYVLLRACAEVAQLEMRILHTGVLSFERRLAWLENRIIYSSIS